MDGSMSYGREGNRFFVNSSQGCPILRACGKQETRRTPWEKREITAPFATQLP